MSFLKTHNHDMKQKLRIFREISFVVLFLLSTFAFGSEAKQSPAANYGGTLRWVVPIEPSAFIPLSVSGSSLGSKVVEGLLDFSSDLTPRPLLATDWTVSVDGLRYEFKLREGVKWHDGKPFTAADVKYSLNKLKQVHPRGRVTFSNIKAIKTPDKHTVILFLAKPTPYLLAALSSIESPIVPKHLYDGKDDAAIALLNNKPIGTGPFVFKEWVKGSHVILEKNKDYWDQSKPYLDRILVKFIPDAPVAGAAIEAKEIDIGHNVVSLSDLERFVKLPHVKTNLASSFYLAAHYQIYFNFDSKPFRKRKVRLAVAQAFDINAFYKTVWYEYGKPSATPIGSAHKRYQNKSIKAYLMM